VFLILNVALFCDALLLVREFLEALAWANRQAPTQKRQQANGMRQEATDDTEEERERVQEE
jgi:hypothetical protein